MKITKDKTFILSNRLASGATFFGCGYLLLSVLRTESATLLAWLFVLGGFIVRLALFRWRRERAQRFSKMFHGWRGQPAIIFTLKAGTARDEVFRQVEQMHGTILRDSPELVSAEFRRSPTTPATRVEFAFRDGKLAKTEIQQDRPDTAPEAAGAAP